MRNFLISICYLLFLFNSARSQEPNPEIQLPSSPGMNIIGILNAEITKPGNYTGVYSNLISPIISNNGTIPTDLAVEFSPYYLESRDLTYGEVAKTNIYRDLKISIASTEVISSDSVIFPRLGIGFRTILVAGNINKVDMRKITLEMPNDINAIIFRLTTCDDKCFDTLNVDNILELVDDHVLAKKIFRIISSNRNSKENAIKELNELQTEIEDLVEVDNSIWDYSLRTGHFIEIAGAFAIDFPRNTLGTSELNRWGFWLNYTFRPKSKIQSIDFSGLLKISNYSFDPTVNFDGGSIFGDFGFSINWRIPKTKFIISSEVIGKAGFSDLKASESGNEYTFKSITESKWNASLGYKITPNILWNISLSDINGNSNYLKSNAMQFLMGLSAALAPLNK